ncbi:C-type lectin domain family 2 member L-like isoform X2 [Lissotriton helveticus]
MEEGEREMSDVEVSEELEVRTEGRRRRGRRARLEGVTRRCLTEELPVPPHPEPCPMDWIYNGRTCYHFSKKERGWKDWDGSQSVCASHNGTLALFDSREELTFLMDLTCGHHMWVGLRRSADEFHWANGTACNNTLCSITDFGDCAYIEDEALRVTGCLLPRPYICTKEPYQ